MRNVRQDVSRYEDRYNPIPHSAFRIPNSNGFTLIEIIITIMIVGIIGGIAAVIIAQGVRAYSDEEARSELHYQGRIAMERVAREARLIRGCADIAGPANPSATLSFTDVNGNAVTFQVAGATLTRNGSPLTGGVTSAQPFRFLDRSGNPTTSCIAPNDIWTIEIDLAVAQAGETWTVRTRVHPRNF